MSRPPRPRLVRIGRSREPVIVVDDAMTDPQPLIEHAASRAVFAPADRPRGGYPGVQAPVPDGYADHLLTAIAPLVRSAFGLADAAVPALVDAALSIVTRPPGALHPNQRLPHFDSPNPRRFACLHYLCDASLGGTAFYRQRATGLEQVPCEAVERFRAARAGELAALPPDAGYPSAATLSYLQTATFGARMNRLLIYRSFSLHSGVIPAVPPLAPNPRAGRLTANLFAEF